MDAAAAQEAFWSGVVSNMPTIIATLIGVIAASAALAIAAINRLTAKLKPAIVESVAEITRERAQYPTPVAAKAEADKRSRAKVGKFTSMLIPAAVTGLEIDHAVSAANAVATARTLRPLGPGESGQHPVVVPPRSPTGFSSDKLRAVRLSDLAGSISYEGPRVPTEDLSLPSGPPPIPRPSGDFGAFDIELPRDPATLDVGEPSDDGGES